MISWLSLCIFRLIFAALSSHVSAAFWASSARLGAALKSTVHAVVARWMAVHLTGLTAGAGVGLGVAVGVAVGFVGLGAMVVATGVGGFCVGTGLFEIMHNG